MSYLIFRETATRGILWKKVFLEILQISQENTFMKKKNLAQVISCEFCEISKNTFFTEHLWKTGFVFNAKTFVWKNIYNCSGTITADFELALFDTQLVNFWVC